MKSFVKINLALLLVVLFPLSGQTTKYAGEFLSTGVGGRALAMGGAYAAMNQDVSAAYWNPAGLTHSTFQEIALMHSERFGDLVNYDYAGYMHPLDESGQSVFAISLIRLGVDDIPFTQNLELVEPDPEHQNGELDAPGEYVIYDEDRIIWESDSELALYFSYGRVLNPKLSVGGNVKFVRKAIGDLDANGFGFDLGVQYRVFDKLMLGANLQDATTTLLLWDSGEQESISPTLKTGLAFVQPLGFFEGSLTAAFDIDTRFEGRDEVGSQYSAGAASFDLHFGMEYFYRRTLALRFGPSAGEMSAGAGVVINKLRFDYAFIGHNDLGDTHRVAGSIRF